MLHVEHLTKPVRVHLVGGLDDEQLVLLVILRHQRVHGGAVVHRLKPLPELVLLLRLVELHAPVGEFLLELAPLVGDGVLVILAVVQVVLHCVLTQLRHRRLGGEHLAEHGLTAEFLAGADFLVTAHRNVTLRHVLTHDNLTQFQHLGRLLDTLLRHLVPLFADDARVLRQARDLPRVQLDTGHINFFNLHIAFFDFNKLNFSGLSTNNLESNINPCAPISRRCGP